MESVFAVLFVLSLVAPVLAVLVGLALLALPTKTAVRSVVPAKQAPVHV